MRTFYIDGLGPKPHVSIGSQALVNAAVEIVERRYPGSEYCFLSACPAVERDYLGQTGRCCRVVQRPKTPVATFFRVRELVKHADAIICPWGDAYISSPPYLALRKVLALRRRGVPRMLMTSSVGPFDRGWKRWLAMGAFRQFDILTVRDSVTYDLFKSLGLDNARLLPDTAFVLEAAGGARIRQIMEAEGIPAMSPGSYVGVNVSVLLYNRMKEAGADYVQLMADLIVRIQSLTGLPVVLIPHQIYTAHMLEYYPQFKERLLEAGGDDRRIFPLLYERLRECGAVHALRGEYSAGDYKGLISGCRLFVGGRMHAVIAALSCGVPSLILEYSHKARGLMQMLSLEQYRWEICRSPETLWKALSLLRRSADEYRDRLLKMVPPLIEQAYSAADALETVLGTDR